MDSKPVPSSQNDMNNAASNSSSSNNNTNNNVNERAADAEPNSAGSHGDARKKLPGIESLKSTALKRRRSRKHPPPRTPLESTPSCSETEEEPCSSDAEFEGLRPLLDADDSARPASLSAERMFKRIRRMMQSDEQELAEHVKTHDTARTVKALAMDILPALGGGPVPFMVLDTSTILDLKDFVLFSLKIPHTQQILTFDSPTQRRQSLSRFPEATRLRDIPGLVERDALGRERCRPVSLVFKMSSGMDVMATSAASMLGDDAFGSTDELDEASGFSVFETSLPELAADAGAAKVLVRSISSGRSSASSSPDAPRLYEVILPDSGVKLIVSAVVNPTLQPADALASMPGDMESAMKFAASVPKLIITPPADADAVSIDDIPTQCLASRPATPDADSDAFVKDLNSLKLEGASLDASPPPRPDPKPFCAHCRVRCRPALRFVCKCGHTYCQTHRYPDLHGCLYDHRAAGQAIIQANNPKIVKDKVENI